MKSQESRNQDWLLPFNKIAERMGPDIPKIEYIGAELLPIEQKLIKELCLNKIQITGMTI